MSKRLSIILATLAMLFFSIWAFRNTYEHVGTNKNHHFNTDVHVGLDEKTKSNGSNADTSPSKETKDDVKLSLKEVGSLAWMSWLRSLPLEEQHEILKKMEASSYPDTVAKDEWKKALVANGPGQNQTDVFPCKILTNYKPLLRPRNGLGVVGLRFLVNKDGGSILTTIWSENAKDAILVDWNNDKIIPVAKTNILSGVGISPTAAPYDEIFYGDNGKLAISNVALQWRTGVFSGPVAVHKDSPVWFGKVYNRESRLLESIVCVAPTPPKILGEIKMPAGKSLIWCLFDVKQKVLLIVDHSWEWIAMIDFSTPPQLDERGK